MIQIVITEDNDTVREGLMTLIDNSAHMQCLAGFGSCEELLDNFARVEEADIFLMDIGLPGMSGIDGVREIKKRKPDALILMLTVYEDEDLVFDALKAGAIGYLLKKTHPLKLIDSIEEAYHGGSPMSSNIARKVVAFFQKSAAPAETKNDLSPREMDILQELCQGNSYKIIAYNLNISIDTVRTHIRKIYRKLQVHSQSEAVIKALKNGIVK
ncbi:DNA-binding response regulator [candidate division KSB1 bacterium]|jgi:DNA-binding NarL/FixJ family response regulator|nr:MAG: DNA-binding response regulator [candidate division KSB1 bacterium]